MVPASLVRLRRFMIASGRLRSKPWAPADEVLDAFHEMLEEHRDEDAFWKGLEDLLASLARDMEKRLASRPGEVIENEILDHSRHHVLLAEIRSALSRHEQGPGAFRRLSSVLSTPAVAMLLVLGGAVVAGCETRTVLEGGPDVASDVAHDEGTDPAPELPVDPPADPCMDMATDTGAIDMPCDPDLEPDADCPHVCMTFEQIVEECVPSEPDRCEYINCIRTMHESWRTGLTELFACYPCWQIESELSCNFRSDCHNHPPGSEFDLEEFLDECHCCIYIGVRFQ